MTVMPNDVDAVASFYEFLLRPAPEPEMVDVFVEATSGETAEPSPTRVSDRIFYALKQFHELEGLVDADSLSAFFEVAIPSAGRLCPFDEADDLRARLTSLRPQARIVAVPPAAPVEMTPAPQPRPEPRESTANGPQRRRFSLILAQLAARSEEEADTDPARTAMLVELLSLATEMSEDGLALRELIRRIPLQKSGRSVFHVLSRGIASWDTGSVAAGDPPRAARAMQQIISLAADTNERARRIRELVMAAVERLNEGSVFAAVTMLELAEEILADASIHSTVVDRIRVDSLRELQDGLDEKLLKDRDRHPLLKRALAFFPPLRDEALLDELHESSSSTRKQMIGSLLEVWGAPTRRLVLERLEKELADPDAAGRQPIHDLIDLLERIPRGKEGDLVAQELEVLARASTAGLPVELVTHALGAIANIRSHAAERLLSRRLAELEAMPFRTDRAFYAIDEFQPLLDAAVAALTRIATPSALRIVVRHCLSQSLPLGDVRSRLRHLSTLDLSIDSDTVALLIKTIREELPLKILGRSVARRQNLNPTSLIHALRATRTAAVAQLLNEVATDFPQLEFGLAAINVLQSQARRAAESSTLEKRSGVLGWFDLPRLLDSTAAADATGLLSLVGSDQEIRGRLWFRSGSLLRVECGLLSGPDALLQLIERPVIGTWAFTEKRITEGAMELQALDVRRLVDEGMRRHDALNIAIAMVPDDATFRPAAVRPGRNSEEADPQLLRNIWVKATSAEPVATWETTLAADSFRVRRVIARWVEEGALEPVV